MSRAKTAPLFALLLAACGGVSNERDCSTEPPSPALPRTELISPWRGGSTQLPASGTSAGPLLQANQTWLVPIGANAGEQLTAMSFRVFGDGAVDVAFGLFMFDYTSNMNTLVKSGVVTDAPATWTETPVVVNVSMNAGQALVFFFQPNAANAFAGLVSADITPLPDQPRPAW